MSTILNSIKQTIGASIKTEVKAPIVRNGKTRYPVLTTDVSQSFTSGWFVQYNPVAQENGTRLYDGAESFSELNIARYSDLHNLILTANYYFLQGHGVELLSGGRKRAIFEPNAQVRLTVTSQTNSVSVVVTIVDETSPFHMMSIPFTVTNHNNNPYVVGSDKFWDRNTDTFAEQNANFAPRKSRFYRVHQQQNSPATLRAKIAVNNGQYAINQDGTFQIDTNAAAPEYIQVITNEFKALAYIYEQALMAKSFELALAQGLPAVSNAPTSNPAELNQAGQAGFVPSFAYSGVVANAGQPNTAFAPPPVQPQTQPQIPLSNMAPPQQQQYQQQQFQPGGNPPLVDPSNLPWNQ